MGKKLYEETAGGGIRFVSERRPGEVRIPNYVYDLWLPLLGAGAIGVYSTYCRLERQGTVKAKTLRDLANAFRMGTDRVNKINTLLEQCAFIRVTKPKGFNRLRHYTTEIAVLDPPREVLPALIAEYQHPQGYETLTPWLVSEGIIATAEDPNRSSERPKQVAQEDPDGASKVAALGLQPSSSCTDGAPETETPEPQEQPAAAPISGRDEAGLTGAGKSPDTGDEEADRARFEEEFPSKYGGALPRGSLPPLPANDGWPVSWMEWGADNRHVAARGDVSKEAIQRVGSWLSLRLKLEPDWANGSEVKHWVSKCAALYRTAGGSVEVLEAVARDMTERALKIAGPWSLMNLVRAEVARRARDGADGRSPASVPVETYR